MGKYGVDRKVISREELLKIEPSLKNFAHKIVGGTFTASDESGDAMVFSQALAQRCADRGVAFLYNHAIDSIHLNRECQPTVKVQGQDQPLSADHMVVACGSYSAPLLRSVGVDLPIYPGKGYSATFNILNPQDAPMVSTIDDAKKIAITRLGDQIRVAGTIEVGGYDLTLDSPLARARCHMLSKRVEEVWPGMCDTRTEEEGGNPRYWTGLRPATPTNIPFIGQTKIKGLWVNAGHGTLGWTHGAGSGKALAELMCGQAPAMAFKFYQG
jgi:D-amino-acid dehydrogenase